MQNFCPSCGNPISENYRFCSKCGATLNVQQNAQSVQQPQPVQPVAQQYAQPPVRQQAQPAVNQYGFAQPKKPKNKGLKIALISVGASLAAIAIIIVIIITVIKPIVSNTIHKFGSEDYSTYEAAENTEPSSDIQSKAYTEAQTEAPAKSPDYLPYADSIGRPAAADFSWIADAQSGNLSGSYLENDELIGKWKGEIIYEGAWELVYVTIDTYGKITIEPYQINYGEGWIDEMDEEPYLFSGVFENGSVNGAGIYGSINLYAFIENGSAQYGVGTFSVNNTSSADVYLVRP